VSSIPNGQKDEWSSASQELFRAARSDHAPTSADRERVRRALAERIAVGQGASSGGSMAGHAASTLSRVLKVGFGVSLVVVATIAVKRAQEPAAPAAALVQNLAAPSGGEPAESVPESTPALVDSAVQVPSRDTALPTRDESASARTPRRAHPRASVAPASAVARVDTQLARASTAQSAASPAEARVSAEPAREQGSEQATERTAPQRQAAVVQPAEQVEPAAAREQRVEQAASNVEAPQDTQADDARAELAFVRKMQSALRAGESDDVLELSGEHAARWPHGTFVQEREGMSAIASCNTSTKTAGARAKAFLTKYPRTPLGPRVREACKLQLKAVLPAAAKTGTTPSSEK